MSMADRPRIEMRAALALRAEVIVVVAQLLELEEDLIVIDRGEQPAQLAQLLAIRRRRRLACGQGLDNVGAADRNVEIPRRRQIVAVAELAARTARHPTPLPFSSGR